MHELSIAMAIMRQLEALAAEHGAERIDEVAVSAGQMRQVVPEALQSAFQFVAEGTCAEGARIRVDIAPMVAACRRCGRRFQPEVDSFLCPQCNQADVDIVEGNDIVLTSVTFQQGEGADEH